jgi:hypothetical protein
LKLGTAAILNQNARRREQKAFKPLQGILNYFWDMTLMSKNWELYRSFDEKQV